MVTDNKGLIVSLFSFVANTLIIHSLALNKELRGNPVYNPDHVTPWHRQGLWDTWLAVNTGAWDGFNILLDRSMTDEWGTPSFTGNQASGYSFVFNSVLDLYKHFPPELSRTQAFQQQFNVRETETQIKGWSIKSHWRVWFLKDAFYRLRLHIQDNIPTENFFPGENSINMHEPL